MKRELQREQALRDLHEAAAKREEKWTRLEAVEGVASETWERRLQGGAP